MQKVSSARLSDLASAIGVPSIYAHANIHIHIQIDHDYRIASIATILHTRRPTRPTSTSSLIPLTSTYTRKKLPPNNLDISENGRNRDLMEFDRSININIKYDISTFIETNKQQHAQCVSESEELFVDIVRLCNAKRRSNLSTVCL